MKHFFHTVTLGLIFLGISNALAADSLVVYTGRSDKFIKPVVEQFTQQTGIKVILHSAKSTELVNKLRVEGKHTKADLFISNDAGNLQVGSDMGLFEKLPAKLVQLIDTNYRAPDDTWVGLSARARVLVVNTNKKEQLSFVHSVLDLANPRLKGHIAITHSANSSFIAGVTVYQKLLGDKKTSSWLKGIKANTKGKVYNKHSKIVSAVASGKKSIGLVNHYYIYRHLQKHPKAPIKVLLPDQDEEGMGVAWNVAGVAIIKHSKKKEDAKKLVKYLLSRKGQKIFANINHEFPTRLGVSAAALVRPISKHKVADVSMYELGKMRTNTLDLLDSVGMY